jgi:hypothetical protein
MAFNRSGLTHVGRKFVTVVTSDTVQVMPGAIGLYVGGTGDIVVTDQDNNIVTFKAVPVGALLPISPKLIRATSTTATLMVLIY